jgi:hypothetical protein
LIREVEDSQKLLHSKVDYVLPLRSLELLGNLMHEVLTDNPKEFNKLLEKEKEIYEKLQV